MALLKYPIFAAPGDAVDIRSIFGSSINYDFHSDYQSPSYLTFRDDRYIDIAADAVTEITPIFIELNNGDEFYLVITPVSAPTRRYAIDEVSMLSDSTYDLNPLVENAKTITFQTGQTQPTGSSLSGGIFTIGTAAGTAYFTATNDTGSTHFSIKINVVQQTLSPENFKHPAKYRVEIAGIDVSSDLREIPSISEGLDYLTLNTYRVNDATVVLNNGAGRYTQEVSGNFWQTQSLNPGGYQERIHIFKEFGVGGELVSHLMFSGFISRSSDNLSEVSFSLVCVDISQNLRKTQRSAFNPLQKWGVLSTQSVADDVFKVYTPETALSPILTDADIQAWQGSTELTLQRNAFVPEGVQTENQARLTSDGLESFGDLTNLPLMQFHTAHTYRKFQQQLDDIALDAGGYQVSLDSPASELDTPHLANLGNIAFDVENTRITRTPVDWVYDETSDSLLILLSNPVAQISDLIVRHDIATQKRTLLYEFDHDIRAVRIARLNATNYYILAISKSSGSFGSIYQYDMSADTLTERVSPTDTERIQPLRFYRNDLMSASLGDRGFFDVVNNTLYYRWFQQCIR